MLVLFIYKYVIQNPTSSYIFNDKQFNFSIFIAPAS